MAWLVLQIAIVVMVSVRMGFVGLAVRSRLMAILVKTRKIAAVINVRVEFVVRAVRSRLMETLAPIKMSAVVTSAQVEFVAVAKRRLMAKPVLKRVIAVAMNVAAESVDHRHPVFAIR